MESFAGLFLSLMLYMALGLIPAGIAKKKGHSFLLWWIYGTVLFYVAVIHALLLRNPDGKRVPSPKKPVSRGNTAEASRSAAYNNTSFDPKPAAHSGGYGAKSAAHSGESDGAKPASHSSPAPEPKLDYSARSAAGVNVGEELRKCKALYEQGRISEAEFNARKEQLLKML